MTSLYLDFTKATTHSLPSLISGRAGSPSSIVCSFFPLGWADPPWPPQTLPSPWGETGSLVASFPAVEDWCLFTTYEENANGDKSYFYNVLSILWLTSITHNSSIDIVSHPMSPVTWFKVRRWASYIISGAEFQQIHYRLSQPSKAPEPMLSPFPSLLPSLSSILITLSSLWPRGAQASPWAFKSPRPWTQ